MNNKYFRLFCLLILITLVAFNLTRPAMAASGAWIAQTYVQGPADNPLKGFMPFQGSYSTFPHSLEWNYVAWSDIQTGPTTYNWAAIDNLLSDVAGRGHQTVFRVYADYPGRPYAVPGFLSGVAKNSYTDYGNSTSFSPNYDDPNLLSAMTNLITAMGARYDGDPRIGFITIGLIGFWGEWHTYRNTCACDTWMPSAATQNTVLNAFDNAFNKTKILLRYPMANSPSLNIGYHDDSFNYATYGTSWYFWPKITAAGVQNKWQTEPFGGEMYPDIQLSTWTSANQCVTGGAGDQQCFNTSVDTTHVSWMIAHQLFSPGNSGSAHTAALAGAKRMGYDLFVSSVALPDTTTSGNVQVSIKLQDKGVAPFYYPWKVQIGVANSSNAVVATWDTTWDLTTVKNASDYQFDFTKSGHGLAAGSYKLLLRAVNPLSNGKPLVFANQKWGQDVANWLTLDTFTVSGGGATPTQIVGASNTPVGPTATRTNTPIGPSPTPTATAVGGVTSYEAEASGNTLAGGAVVSACAPCSGGNKVGFVGNNAGTLQFNGVSAPATGSYTLTIYYANGDTVARSVTVSVNGGAGTNMSLPVTGSWTTIGSVQTSISLNAGSSNTIKFSNATGWAPDFDRITINTGSSPTATRTNTPVGPTATKTNTPVGPTPTSSGGLILDNFDGAPTWSAATTNDLGKWAGANGFVNGTGGAGVSSGGALVLQYNNNGWFGSDVTQDVSSKTYLVFVIKGAAGGEQNAFHVSLGGVDKTFAAFSGDTITTAYKTIRINMVTNGVNRTAPGQLNMTFWWGSSGTITIDEIRFE